jgi:phosphatidylglycerol:prolipoprotein diacylglycerol transferase
MLIHPQFDPIAVSLGPLAIHWYALSYILAFFLFIVLGRYRIKAGGTLFTKEMLDDLLTWGILGVILGGRIGYVLFYQLDVYMANPLNILKVWEGGMSFHGGFLGVLAAMWLFAKRRGLGFWQVMDFVAPLVPLGLASGRIGNFINGELWGAASNPQYTAWFSQFGMLPRHPSQLYQFALEGITLFIIVWLFSKKPRPTGQVAMVFLAGYGIFRFIAEYARQPDEQLGLLTLGLSMGQWLSLPMIILGVIGFVYFGKRNQTV